MSKWINTGLCTLVILFALGNNCVVKAGRSWVNTKVTDSYGSYIQGESCEIAMRSGNT